MLGDVVGPNGINNRNMKGKVFLYLLKTNNFKIVLSYFTHTNYVTYRSFNSRKTPRMYDTYISCNKLFLRMQDCNLVNYGATRDHTATMIKFRITAIKFKNDRKERIIIDWKKSKQIPI